MSIPPDPPLDFPEIDCLIDDVPSTLPKARVTSSLDDIRAWTSAPPKRPHRNSCQISAFEAPRRKSSASNRRSSVASSRRHKTSSATTRKWLSPEQKARERKRRRTVYIVVGTFLFILFSCVLVVIVTLTHQSEWGRRNSTVARYYTFAPPADVELKTLRPTAGEEVYTGRRWGPKF